LAVGHPELVFRALETQTKHQKDHHQLHKANMPGP